MEEAEAAAFSLLPNDIIHTVLSKLPVRSRVRFKCVCKERLSLIQTFSSNKYVGQRRRLIVLSRKKRSRNKRNTTRRRLRVRSIRHDLRLEKHRQPFGDSSLSLDLTKPGCVRRYLCSLNELVLLSVGSDIILWNPFTRCCTKVLENPFLSDESFHVVSGLCRDSSTGEYKVVLLITRYDWENVIFSSLEDKKWRGVHFPFNPRSIRRGIDFNDTCHWRVCDVTMIRHPLLDHERSWDPFADPNRIIYFDPASEEFRILPSPDPRDGEEENSIVSLGVIGDCFSIARRFKEKDVNEILVMKEYGVKESWVSAFFIPASYCSYYRCYNLEFYSSSEMSTRILFRCSPSWMTFVYDNERNECESISILEDDDEIVWSWFCVDPPCKQQKYFREFKGSESKSKRMRISKFKRMRILR